MKGAIHRRESFLEKLSNQLGRERRASIEPPRWKFNPQAKVLEGVSQDELVNVLQEQCKKISTECIITNLENLQESIKDVVNHYGGGPIVTWKDDRFVEYGLTPLLKKEWPDTGIDVHQWDHTMKEENIMKARDANVGMTISELTLAESGTAVLFSNKDKGRTVSFLPANSIIIIPKSSIVPRMTQAAKLIREKVKKGEQVASCINFITGPSNSADIEMILVVGVHGPIKATYIVVEDI